MISNSTKIAVITGGPGSGKTTLCDLLSQEGLEIGCESGRAVLARAEGHELRQQDPLAYSQEILQLDIENFKTAKRASGSWLFDRGFPDNAGYLDLMGLGRPNNLDEVCRNLRYTGPIFAAPPWQEIFHGDDDRTQDWEEAKATFAAVTAAWKQYGYELVELPKTSVEKRAVVVKDRLA